MKIIIIVILSILFSLTELFAEKVNTNFGVIVLQSGERQFLNTILLKKKSIINFWSVDCPPCLKEIPELLKLQSKFENVHFIFIHININDSINKNLDEKIVIDIAKELGIYHLTYLDSYKKVFLEFTKNNEVAIPATIIWDKQKGIIFKSIGYDTNTISTLEANLNKTLPEK